MEKLYHIYSGCPLKFYFGKKKYFNFQYYYSFENAANLVKDLFDAHK